MDETKGIITFTRTHLTFITYYYDLNVKRTIGLTKRIFLCVNYNCHSRYKYNFTSQKRFAIKYIITLYYYTCVYKTMKYYAKYARPDNSNLYHYTCVIHLIIRLISLK